MDIIYKTIKTRKGNYVYDRNRNAILAISESEFDELEAISKKTILPENSIVVKKYQKDGYLLENRLKNIEHPYTSTLKHHLNHHIEQMTLQVTQRCNLRCEYCVYSGNYDNRVHSTYDMDKKTAFKAIDLYLKSSEEMDSLALGFYGGEPILRFDLIKQCVAYIKEKAKGKKIHFVLTTNGTVLSDEVVEYLNDNNFNITISLDGSKNEHNYYRKFADGTGSFDIIMDNVRNIKKNYPHLLDNTSFNTVINPMHNYKNIKNYLEKDEIISKALTMMTLVESKEAGEEIQFSEEFKLIRKYDYFKLLLHMIGKLDMKFVSKLVLSEKEKTYQLYEQIIKKLPISETGHHGGPCIPGAKRMFVDVHGNIYPCERVSETSEVMKIGHIDVGFDLKKVENLLNVGKLTKDACLQCWAFLHCDICAARAYSKDHLSSEIKCLSCPTSRKEALDNLMQLCVLKELGCTFSLE